MALVQPLMIIIACKTHLTAISAFIRPKVVGTSKHYPGQYLAQLAATATAAAAAALGGGRGAALRVTAATCESRAAGKAKSSLQV